MQLLLTRKERVLGFLRREGWRVYCEEKAGGFTEKGRVKALLERGKGLPRKVKGLLRQLQGWRTSGNGEGLLEWLEYLLESMKGFLVMKGGDLLPYCFKRE